jgi:hypothetical protein
VEALRVSRRVHANAELSRQFRGVGFAPEMKFYQATGNMGILSQNTWQNQDQFGSITAGTGQANRLGRQIRVHRVRYVLRPSTLAAESMFGFSHVRRLDPTVSASDMFPGSGSARALYQYPPPLLQSSVYDHRIATAMDWVGAARGTTPSYVDLAVVVDQKFERGFVINYDLAGAVVGPSPFLYFAVDETSITMDWGCQIWFTDE